MLIERFQQLCKFIGTKETFRKVEKRLNSHKIAMTYLSQVVASSGFSEKRGLDGVLSLVGS